MIDVSRETIDGLAQYEDLILKWNPRINLVASSTLADLQERHIRDCAQLITLSVCSHTDWLDIGSGGGLPGLVIAIARPDVSVTLMESDQRKVAFIRTVVRELGLKNTTVIAERIECALPLNASNVSARALAPLPSLMSYVQRHLAPSGTAWLMKGRNWKTEVEDAKKSWKFDLTAHQSSTDPEAAVLEISGIRHD